MAILGQEVAEPVELYLVVLIVLIALTAMVFIERWMGE